MYILWPILSWRHVVFSLVIVLEGVIKLEVYCEANACIN